MTDENYCKTYDEFKDNSTGFYRAMNTVLSKNQVAPEQVDFISIAGNSYKATDATEQAAIERIFKDTSRMGYVASKAIFGETLGASEVLAVISALLCMDTARCQVFLTWRRSTVLTRQTAVSLTHYSQVAISTLCC